MRLPVFTNFLNMKKLLPLLLFLVISLTARSQAIQFTASVPHTTGTPSGAPTGIGAWIRYDKTNKILYQWTGAAWTRVVGAVADGDKGDITTSSSGTNWQIDAGVVANAELASGTGGIYKGSGTVPASTTATAASGLTITNSGTGVLTFGDPSGNRVEIGPTYGYLGGTQYSFTASSDDSRASVEGPKGSIEANNTGLSLQIGATATIGAIGDNRASPKGMEYSGDYSATYTDRSLVDKAYVVSQNGTNANLTGPVTSVGNATTITANSIDSTHVSNGTISPNDLAQRGASIGQVMTYTSNGWRAGTALSDGDKGDITVSSSGATWDIDASAVGSSEIAANAIDSTKVAASGLSPSDLGPSGASVGQVMTYTANGWRPAAAAAGGLSDGGNSTGSAIAIGTNDAFGLNLETNNVTRLGITGGASTGGALTHTDVTANTSTVETNVTRTVNSSGTAAAGFGQRQLFRLESSTTNAQDAAAMDALWTTATHASRTADIVFSNVNSAASLAETFRVAGNGNLTSTSLVTNTNTAADILTLRANSTGTPAANFGGSILFQGESNTTNNQNMNRIRSYYLDPDNTFPYTALAFDMQDANGGGLVTPYRFYGTSTGEFYIGVTSSTRLRRQDLTPGVDFTLGGNTNNLTIGNSSGGVGILSSKSSTTAIELTPSSATDANNRIAIGTVGATNTSGNKVTMEFQQGYTASSGTGTLTSLRFGNTINQTSTASGALSGIEIAPTLTSVTGSYRAVNIAANHSNAKGIYQSGASTTNNLVGKTMLGATSAPAEMLDITGNVKVIGQKYAAKFALTDGATVAVDWDNSNVQSVTIAGNRTFTFADPKSGAEYVLLIKQDATGTRTVTWPTVLWQGGVAPVLTVSANKTDIVRLFYDGTSYYGSATLNY